MDDGRVQRDQMSGPSVRDSAVVFDLGAEVTADEIAVIGSRDGQPAEAIFQIEAKPHAGPGHIRWRKKGSVRWPIGEWHESPWLYQCRIPG